MGNILPYNLSNALENSKIYLVVAAHNRPRLIVLTYESIAGWVALIFFFMEARMNNQFTFQTAEKEEFEYKQKELERIATPIISKLYQQGGMPPGETEAQSRRGGRNEPTIEEVD